MQYPKILIHGNNCDHNMQVLFNSFHHTLCAGPQQSEGKVFNANMKLHNFLHRTCVIIPLSNGVEVCGTQGPRALGIFNTWFYTL